jgi:hypothetical protein
LYTILGVRRICVKNFNSGTATIRRRLSPLLLRARRAGRSRRAGIRGPAAGRQSYGLAQQTDTRTFLHVFEGDQQLSAEADWSGPSKTSSERMNSSTIRSISLSLTPARTWAPTRTRARATRSPAASPRSPSCSAARPCVPATVTHHFEADRATQVRPSGILSRATFGTRRRDVSGLICQARSLGLPHLYEYGPTWDEGSLVVGE